MPQSAFNMNVTEVFLKKITKIFKPDHGELASTNISVTDPSSIKMWRSRISWRIALSAFFTILAVQTAILTLSIEKKETNLLDEVREVGRSTLVPSVERGIPPISPNRAEKLISATLIRGISVYTTGMAPLMTFGEPVLLNPVDSTLATRRSMDGQSYEVIYSPSDIGGKQYYIAARLDSSEVDKTLIAEVEQTLLIMLLMSAFVTTVLMISISHWLLEPILFMRDNLIAASKNPEEPNIPASPYDPNDEIGQAISIAQKLIRQNAENMRQVKTAAEDKIHKLAYYDNLTSLPNRTMFIQRLSDHTKKSADSKETRRLAIVAVDLDHFKDINDSMGHNIGDAILRAVGKRLRSSMPESSFVARTGEDEFAVMTPLTNNAHTAKDIAEKVINIIRLEPFKVFNENFQVRASIGVSTFPDDAVDPDQVLKNADIALNRAKEEGKDTVKEYSEDFDKAVQARFQMLRDLRDALEKDELTLHYQPQFDLKTGRLIGAEALIRWWKPDNSKHGGSFISPVEFIPIAEQSGLIVPIGEWVLHKACEAALSWTSHDGEPLRIAVNVSGAQFYQSDLVTHVKKVLKETGIESNRLELEVTESMFMDDIQHTVKTLQDLHSLGVELAIDDFGTGYSSLSYLRQFPIDRLKIDQSFIRNALNNADDAAITKTIIQLGHSLNLKVIAEGVETKDHESFLVEESCDEVQGYRYSKPIAEDDFNNFLDQYQGKLSSFD